MKGVLFYGGIATAVAGAGLPLILPSLPSVIQESALAPVGTFIIANQNWIILAGLLLMLVSLFL